MRDRGRGRKDGREQSRETYLCVCVCERERRRGESSYSTPIDNRPGHHGALHSPYYRSNL